ncbi:MAG: hypothetical protein AAF581_03675 [Planctomycetota bacterium]
MPNRFTTLLVMTSGLILCSTARADESATRLQNLLVALGGRDQYSKSLNAHITATVRTVAAQPGLEVKATVTRHNRDDGSVRVERNTQGQVRTIGTDTHNYWQQQRDGKVSPLAAEEKTGLQLDVIREQLPLRYAELGYIATAGEAGSLTFRRKGVSPEARAPGDRFHFVLDPKTHLPKSVTFDRKDPFGKRAIEHTIQFANYRTVSGVPIAHTTTRLRGGKPTHTTEVTKIEIGKRAPDARFLAPTEKPPTKG